MANSACAWKRPYALYAFYSIFFLSLIVIASNDWQKERTESNHGNYIDDHFFRLLETTATPSQSSVDENQHKPLLPFTTRDFYGTLLIGLGLMIAASGGVGGGGILVPLLILVLEFHPKYAIPLSNFTILGSSLMNMVINTYKRHPEVDRPLVDWDLILVMEPLTMAGAIVGALVGKVLPDWILVTLLVLLLAQTSYTTLDKAISQYRKETSDMGKFSKSELARAVDKEIELIEVHETVSLLSDQHHDEGDDGAEFFRSSPSKVNKEENNDSESGLQLTSPYRAPLSSTSSDAMGKQLEEVIESEKNTSGEKVLMITALVVVVITLNMLKGGGKSFPSPLGIKCGTQGYWVLTAIVFVWILAVSMYTRQVLIDRWRLKKELRYKYAKGDIEWNERNTLVYPAICFFAGFFAGMFGIGGGIVKGPLMLQIGVHPLVASGTVAVMIMFTSVSATTMFLAFGTITWDYAWFLFVVGLVTTAAGQFGVSYLVDKYKRYSYISFSIGAVVAMSTVLMSVQAVFSLVDAQQNGSSSSTICPKV